MRPVSIFRSKLKTFWKTEIEHFNTFENIMENEAFAPLTGANASFSMMFSKLAF